MVFGWGKKKPQQIETDIVPEVKEIELSKVNDVIKEIRTLRLKTLIAEVRTFRNKINSNCKTILDIVTELENDSLNLDDVDEHLVRLVRRGKNEVISVIKKESSTTLPEINTFDDVKIFNVRSTRVLKKIGDVLGRQSRVIHIFAKKYANKLKNDLKTVTDENKEIDTLVKNYIDLESKIEQILENLEKHNQSKKSIVVLREQQKQAKNDIQDIDNTINNNIESIKNLKESNEYLEYLKIKEEINSLSSSKNNIKISQINDIFSKLDTFIERISSFDKSRTDLENKLSVFNMKTLIQMESRLTKYQNEKSNFKSRITTLGNEINDMLESQPKYIKSIKSILDDISAIRYSIKAVTC